MATPTDPQVLFSFGERLVALRNRTGFPQKKVAEFLGVTSPMLSNWEAGNSEPKFFQVVALARLYDVSLDVLAGSAPMPPPVQRPETRRRR